MSRNRRFTIQEFYRTTRKKYFTVNIGSWRNSGPFLFFNMGWKTLVVKNSEKISLFLNNILIHQRETNYRIYIGDIDCILFEDYKTVLTTRMLGELSKNNIIVIICDEQLMPVSYVYPIKAKFNQLEIINQQLKWDRQFKIKMWEEIIKQKINNQIDILKINHCSQEKIKKLYGYIAELHDGDVSNREGHAAKVYFKELFGHGFTREQDGLTNSALNYGYTVIRSAVSRSIVAKGLHPSIALFHHNMYDAFALADDLMEPFRPLVDNFVFQNVNNWQVFGREQKIALINLLNSVISFEGKEQYLANAINMYVDSIITSFTEQSIHLIHFPYTDVLKYYEL